MACRLGFFLCLSAVAMSSSIFDYIQNAWRQLTRSHSSLAIQVMDPKFPLAPGARYAVYIGPHEDPAAVGAELKQQMGTGFQRIELLPLPSNPREITRHGLLYLPHPYVVPGGRFNEMYGWDSFFIQMGLLRDGQIELAKNMADNFLYEIREYGHILNANRTYYLTRSQPPFLTEMLLAVYDRTKDKQWLADSLPAIETYYEYWTTEPHLTKETGLSRYFDSGEGPAPEVTTAERDSRGRSEYDLIKRYFHDHRVTAYDVSQYYDAKRRELTPLFYRADRAMRESGFDPSSRFGPFSAAILDHNPVCLNSLLYLMEAQTAQILEILDRSEERDAWRARAQSRAGQIQRLMWSDKDGLYYDFDFVHQRVRPYPFLTTFYPLWAGFATKEQAARVVAHLPDFERAGGLLTSTFHSGDQWDAPFGWAPLEWIAVEGLRRYGYAQDAERISVEFLSMISEDFHRRGTMLEKYDVVRRASDVSSGILFGYRSNEAGFGWTNAVFEALYDELPAAQRGKIGPQ